MGEGESVRTMLALATEANETKGEVGRIYNCDPPCMQRKYVTE